MENSSFRQIREALEKSKIIGILTPKDPDLDKMAAALALYLSLLGTGKEVMIATPQEPLVEVSSLVGIDKVKTNFEGGKGDLVVSFPYQEGAIEKVSYTLENDFLNIIIKAGENGLSFNEQDIRYAKGHGIPELLFVIGAEKISDLGKLFDPTQLKNTTIVNITNHANGQGFGDIHVISDKFSSVSEAVGNIVLSLGLKIDVDIAQNLMAGISFATENFQSPNTSPLAFELVGVLLRAGAVRNPVRTTVEKPVTRNQQDITKELQNFFSLNQSSGKQQPTRVSQVSHKIQRPEQERIKEDQREQDNPPEDWLSPKIYKGSTDFE